MGNGYKDLVVWQKSKKFCVDLYKVTEEFPKAELYGLTSQMRRAAVSVPSNIAEGSRRGHEREQCQFYRIAYGSGGELETQIEIAKELFQIHAVALAEIEKELTEVMKMLNKLITASTRSS